MCRRESGWALPLSKQKINPRKQFRVGGGGGEEVAQGMQCPANKSGSCRAAGFKYERETAIF